ncbi:uncharacterized protein N7511_001104 [Penicillium nucicola]|uniref:uncharacterized protein n=1 Tax=Penicillium nucicola TaxID=1850975 RepID=UPI0025457356|nr:uncharacterized protein N7511_001104 [Penicillium nucicola]KAJ5776093.1 hypothetical protein N7511_001104 [Penicillium nucicola]
MAGSPNSNLRGFNHAVQTLLKQPTQFLPHLTIPTITHLPENLGPHLVKQPASTSTPTPTTTTPRTPTIRALRKQQPSLRKFSPNSNPSGPPQPLPFNQTQNPYSILIVSNRAGSHATFDNEVSDLEAQLAHLQIPVFRLPAGAEKKPFCGEEVVAWFRERGVVKDADEIAVVGDRLGTDVLMAGMMGSWSVWCKEGVFEVGEVGKPGRNVLEKMEVWIEGFLRGWGFTAPVPGGWEEGKKNI